MPGASSNMTPLPHWLISLRLNQVCLYQKRNQSSDLVFQGVCFKVDTKYIFFQTLDSKVQPLLISVDMVREGMGKTITEIERAAGSPAQVPPAYRLQPVPINHVINESLR
jgi:hypothetical protein